MNEKSKNNICNIDNKSEYYNLIKKYPSIKNSHRIAPFDYDNFELFSKMPYYYIDYKEYDKFILCGHSFSMVITGLLEDRYKITLFIISNQINHESLDEIFDYRGDLIISFYSKNNRLINRIPTKIDHDIKVYNKNLYQINFNMPHSFIRCMCGFSGHIYQNIVTYMSRNISNIIYKTHDLPKIDKELGYINITKGDNDEFWREKWIKRYKKRMQKKNRDKLFLHIPVISNK